MTASSVAGALAPRITPGEYRATFLGWETTSSGPDRKKLRLRFEVAVDSWNRVELSRYYNVVEVIGKPSVGGSFRIGAQSDACRELCLALGQHFDPANIDLNPMRRRQFLVEVETVSKDGLRRPIPEPLQYSKVARVIQPIEPSS